MCLPCGKQHLDKFITLCWVWLNWLPNQKLVWWYTAGCTAVIGGACLTVGWLGEVTFILSVPGCHDFSLQDSTGSVLTSTGDHHDKLVVFGSIKLFKWLEFPFSVVRPGLVFLVVYQFSFKTINVLNISTTQNCICNYHAPDLIHWSH